MTETNENTRFLEDNEKATKYGYAIDDSPDKKAHAIALFKNNEKATKYGYAIDDSPDKKAHAIALFKNNE